MNILEHLRPGNTTQNQCGKIYGVVVGIVTNIEDPENIGRIKVKFPWLIDEDESNWARIATLMGGPDRGSAFIPEVDDEVLLAFDHGDVRHPYILGALWNGQDKPPAEKEGDTNNNLRLFKSRSGHLLVFDDSDGSEKIEIIDKTGNNKITIDSSENKIIVESDGDIKLLAAKGTILLEGNNIEIKSSAGTKIESGASMEVKASAAMTVKGATVNIN